MSTSYDVAVVGLGAMGSAATYHLARRGIRVLALEANTPGTALGSSHGLSRIIREAHPEGDEYVPLVQHAYGLWEELAEETGRQLLVANGGLAIGRRDSAHVQGRLDSARRHDLRHELLSAQEVNYRYPAFTLPDELVAYFDPRAGVLAPEACIAAHLEVAIRHGADLRYGEPVLEWRPNGDGVRLKTDRETYHAGRLAVTTGPWAGELLADLHLPLTTERIVNAHFDVLRPEDFTAENCPVYQLSVGEGYYYGFPAFPGQGIKLGAYNDCESCTPETIRRTVDAAEVGDIRNTFDRYLPAAVGAARWALTCMYTSTPDGHFIIDHHPASEHVLCAVGFGGRGFKFSSVVGEIVADLAITGRTGHPIEFLSATRFGRVSA
ncbi:MAG: N-methyl-L-tryptophan oxidase [Pseudonocardiaceae bacterium]|nr:N-methyl-L-tryptophan oxidase [Pseudonocardiaceae bacterium]